MTHRQMLTKESGRQRRFCLIFPELRLVSSALLLPLSRGGCSRHYVLQLIVSSAGGILVGHHLGLSRLGDDETIACVSLAA